MKFTLKSRVVNGHAARIKLLSDLNYFWIKIPLLRWKDFINEYEDVNRHFTRHFNNFCLKWIWLKKLLFSSWSLKIIYLLLKWVQKFKLIFFVTEIF